MSEDALRTMLSRASDALGMLLLTWHHMESMVQSNPEEAFKVRDVREKWGNHARLAIDEGALPSVDDLLAGVMDDDFLADDDY